MNVQLDWQAADDDDNWESIAQVGTRTRLRLPGWMWPTLAAVVVLLVVGMAIALQYRYRRALRQVTAQIQDAIDLEARALAQGDVARYLALQDASLPGWVVRQAGRLDWACPAASSAEALSAGVCPLAAPVQVAGVEMRGDVAWVEVIAPQAGLRQVRFYRQTRQGWLHTAPHVAFWQDPVELVRGRVLARAHRRDLPHIEPQVAHIVGVVEDVCAILNCPADAGLEVHFSHHDVPPRLSGTALVLPSPWLTGVPVDEAWDVVYARTLTYWTVYGLASQVVYYGCDNLWWPDAFPPDPACKEMLRTCATLYSRSGRHGEEALPEILGPMQDACRLQGFAAY
jgi:hypothetical protein